MNWEAFLTSPEFPLLASIGAATWYLIRREVEHKKMARFDIALSKIYIQLERYIVAANKVKVNINTMPLDFLHNKKSKDLDEWITFPIYEMENMSLLTEMFFKSKDRSCFKNIVSAALDFNYELHKAASISDNITQLSIYDKARSNFNNEYSTNMNDLVNMINDRLLGKWEYDLTSIRLPILRCYISKYKRSRK